MVGLREAKPVNPNPTPRCIREVRDRGAHPVLATPVVRRQWSPAGVLEDSHGPYLTAMRAVAAEEKVPLLEMEGVTRALVTRLGPAGSKPLYLNFEPGEHPRLPEGKHDNTHFTTQGARLVAALAAGEMRRLQLPFADQLKIPDAAVWNPDLGDGRYRNPVLHADYSDPDAIRVGDDFWMTVSSFSQVPGLPILHSRDLVHWNLVGHALPRLVPESAFLTPQPGKGVWAPAIRYHAGKFWIYYPDPDFGLYVITATDPRGPWSAPLLVCAGKGLIDPCPFWDDDGRVYLVHAWARSRSGHNNRLTLLRLNAEGTRVEEDYGVVINGDQLAGYSTLEGPKLYRHGGWYYVFAPAGGVTTGWQSVFRAQKITGPFEDRIVLDQGHTPINGPHQGALVDTPSGEWWFLHFQDQGAYGRVVHLEPVTWKNDWPVIGADSAGKGKGEPVLTYRKPMVADGGGTEAAGPPTSDEFDASVLGLQWQWQANPEASWSSLTARPGHLRLFCQAGPLSDAPNLLLQKFPAEEFRATTKLEFAPQSTGDTAGLLVFGRDYAWLGLRTTGGERQLVHVVVHDASGKAAPSESVVLPKVTGPVWLQVTVSTGASCQFAYSVDGQEFAPAGPAFKATAGRWVGAKVGLFAQAGQAPGGRADFEWFRVESAP